METFGFKTGRKPEFRPGARRPLEDTRSAEEKALSAVLLNAACESITDALGIDVLQILVSRGIMDELDNPAEFDRQLRLLFGNGAVVLERLVAKELCHELGIPYTSTSAFDYKESIQVAREFCMVKGKVK